MKKLIAVLIAILVIITLFAGCDRQSDRVSYNLSLEADSFNVTRQLTVINLRSDKVIFQMIGNFSIEKAADGDLEVIGENDNGTYYKHFVNLQNQWTTYIVEDLGTTTVNKHKYEINFNPDMIIPYEATIVD